MPPVVRARAGSARQNRVKTFAASPGRRPTPWSATTKATASVADRDVDVDGPALAVLDGVDDEVAQDALDPALVDLGLGGLVGQVQRHLAPAALGERPGRLDDLGDRAPQVDRLDVERGGAGVEAADLEQVREQRLEAVELACEQLGRPGHGGVEARRATRG